MVKRALLASVFFLVAGCFPAPLDETGKNCSADHPCGDGFTCFDLRCFSNDGGIDAGPENWLLNSDFEMLNDAGSILGWRAVNGADLDPDSFAPHHGNYAARIFSDDGGTPTLVPNQPPVKNTLLGQIWCARAWTRAEYAGDSGMPVVLFIQERYDDGGTPNNSTPTRPKVYREWVLQEESYVTQGADKLDARVAFGQRARKGEAVFVDEMKLKRIVSGPCIW